MDDSRLARSGGLEKRTPSPLFSRRFVVRIADALESGRLSLRKANRFLNLNTEELGTLCRTYGLELS